MRVAARGRLSLARLQQQRICQSRRVRTLFTERPSPATKRTPRPSTCRICRRSTRPSSQYHFPTAAWPSPTVAVAPFAFSLRTPRRPWEKCVARMPGGCRDRWAWRWGMALSTSPMQPIACRSSMGTAVPSAPSAAAAIQPAAAATQSALPVAAHGARTAAQLVQEQRRPHSGGQAIRASRPPPPPLWPQPPMHCRRRASSNRTAWQWVQMAAPTWRTRATIASRALQRTGPSPSASEGAAAVRGSCTTRAALSCTTSACGSRTCATTG